MTGFLDRMLGKNNKPEKGSGAIAKDRLKMVLTHDRIKVSPEKMKEMKAEIVAIIAKYIPEIDPDSVDIALEQSDRYQNKLVAEIPFTKERGLAPRDTDGNDDLLDKLDKSDTEATKLETGTSQDNALNISLEGDTEIVQVKKIDLENDDTIKSRPAEDE